jgi:hypothetical protein
MEAPHLAPMEAVPPAGLPLGWERSTAPDGRVFFIDHNTQTTHWTPPAAPPAYAPVAGAGAPTEVAPDLASVPGTELLQRKLEEKRASLRAIAAIEGIGPEQLRGLEQEVAELAAKLRAARHPAGVPPQPAPVAPRRPSATHTPGLANFGADRIQRKIDGLRATIELLATTGGGGSTQQLEAELAELQQRHAELTGGAPAEVASGPAVGPEPEPEEELLECPVCMDDKPPREMFDWGCGESHKLCRDPCIMDLVGSALDTGEVPICPLCPDRPPMARNKLRWLVGPQSEQWAAFKQIEMRSFIAAGTGDAGGGAAGGMCLVACPGADCGNFLLNEEPELMREVRCDQDGGCGMSFCSLCREPWHRNGTTCEQARQIRTDWLSWIATGRQEYQRQLGQEAAGINAQAAADAAASLANMRQDEEWKAANCRHCPSCNRIVNHMGGCSAMVCGRNYHGGDVQDVSRPFPS